MFVSLTLKKFLENKLINSFTTETQTPNTQKIGIQT